MTPTRTPIMTSRRTLLAGAGALAVSASLAACGGKGSSSGSSKSIKVVYQKTSSFHQLEDLLKKAKTEYEKANSGMTVELTAIEGEQDQYFTKLALMNGSKDTAPDVMYEDAFQIRTDAAAGYLNPIDDYVAKWSDWSQYTDSVKEAGKGEDDKYYGVSLGTDTRAIYFNKTIFKEVGLAEDWQPKNWDEILEAARTIKAKKPDVIPFNMYASKAIGEGTSMQSFEMLLYGTDDTLYDTKTKKWVKGSQGFKDSLTFLKTVYDEGLGPSLDQALDANFGSRVSTELFPQGKIAMAVDGSWMPGGWISGENAWPEWEKTIAFAKMPTQKGQGAGFTSMSGGWTLAMGAQTKNADAAFAFMKVALDKANALKYDTENSQIAVRKDVAEDKTYLDYNPSFEFFSSLVEVTHFRPSTPDYSQISGNIQIACEDVVSGNATPEQAAKTYDEGLVQIVGDDNTQEA